MVESKQPKPTFQNGKKMMMKMPTYGTPITAEDDEELSMKSKMP